MIAWRKNWAAACRRWTETGLSAAIHRKMSDGISVHGWDFSGGRDPIAEARDELIDGLHYLHAASFQRAHLVGIIERQLVLYEWGLPAEDVEKWKSAAREAVRDAKGGITPGRIA